MLGLKLIHVSKRGHRTSVALVLAVRYPVHGLDLGSDEISWYIIGQFSVWRQIHENLFVLLMTKKIMNKACPTSGKATTKLGCGIHTGPADQRCLKSLAIRLFVEQLVHAANKENMNIKKTELIYTWCYLMNTLSVSLVLSEGEPRSD